MAQGSPTEEQQ
jgi:hypothetical protein